MSTSSTVCCCYTNQHGWWSYPFSFSPSCVSVWSLLLAAQNLHILLSCLISGIILYSLLFSNIPPHWISLAMTFKWSYFYWFILMNNPGVALQFFCKHIELIYAERFLKRSRIISTKLPKKPSEFSVVNTCYRNDIVSSFINMYIYIYSSDLTQYFSEKSPEGDPVSIYRDKSLSGLNSII